MDDIVTRLLDPSKLTVAFLLALTVVAFWKEWIVPGTTYTKRCTDYETRIAKLETERDEFKDMAMQSIEITERTQRVRGAALGTPTGNAQ